MNPVSYPHFGLPIAADYSYPGQNGYSADGQNSDLQNFDIVKILLTGFRYRWLIAAMLLMGLVCGLIYTWQQVPLYRSTTKLEISSASAKVFRDFDVYDEYDSTRTFLTAIQRIQSGDLARRVVHDLNLSEESDFLKPAASFSLRNIIKKIIGRNMTFDMSKIPKKKRMARAISKVQSNLSAALIRNTSVISINYYHPNPEFAAKISNQVALSFIDMAVDKKSETSVLARQFVHERVLDTKDKLARSEKDLHDYATRVRITNIGDDTSLISENIREINQALSKAIEERLGAGQVYEQVKSGKTASLKQVFENEAIQSVKSRIIELKANYQEKLATLKPSFPEQKRLKAQIDALTRQLNIEIVSIGLSIQVNHEQLKAKETALRNELSIYEKQETEFREKRIGYTLLKREVDSYRTQYDTLIAKLNELGIGSELKTVPATVIDKGLVPTFHFTPRLHFNLAIVLAIFASLAVCIIYILEMMNNTFAVPDQLEQELKVPLLGIIPYATESQIQNSFDDDKSVLSEAYRSLRTSLQFTGTENDLKSLLITSSEPNEGKSTTAFKLAKDFAALGRKVLVIDADLRKPRLHRLFGTDNGIGLSNLLTNVVRTEKVASIFRTTDIPGVTFLSAGTIPPNPADILVSQKMGLLLHFCAKRYDFVIIDSPPIMGLSDAPIISRQVDGTLLMVSSKQVSRKAANLALSRLTAVGGNVVGTAMTKFAVDKVDQNYSYQFMNQYYYKYAGDEESLGPNSEEQVPVKALENKPLIGVFVLLRGFARRFG